MDLIVLLWAWLSLIIIALVVLDWFWQKLVRCCQRPHAVQSAPSHSMNESHGRTLAPSANAEDLTTIPRGFAGMFVDNLVIDLGEDTDGGDAGATVSIPTSTNDPSHVMEDDETWTLQSPGGKHFRPLRVKHRKPRPVSK